MKKGMLVRMLFGLNRLEQETPRLNIRMFKRGVSKIQKILLFSGLTD